MNKQLNEWAGDFGRQFTKRNAATASGVDGFFKEQFGVSRTKLNELFLGRMKRSSRILEIGCNAGNQLLVLGKMGFTDLYAIEPQDYALQLAKKRLPQANIIKGDVFELPFKDNYFDVVFTSVVLIHIAPKNISKAMREIYRCSKKYIWGFEYFSSECTEVVYRGKKNMLWKTDFIQTYLNEYKDLKLVKRKEVPYLKSDNKDVMFLLKKT